MRGVFTLLVLGFPLITSTMGCDETEGPNDDLITDDAGAGEHPHPDGSAGHDASTHGSDGPDAGEGDAAKEDEEDAGEDAPGEDEPGDAGKDAAEEPDAGEDTQDAAVEVEVVFEARVGEEPFSCDASYSGLGTSAAEASPLDFRLYVHDVRLVTAGGEELPLELKASDFVHEDVTLLDFEDNSGTCSNGNSITNYTVMGSVPEDDYVGLAFTVGVPEALNHEDPAAAASPLNLTALHWNWAGGYKFARIDFKVDTAAEGTGAPFNFHLGSTLCEGDPGMGDTVTCDHSNRPTIEFDDFDPRIHKVVIDYAALVQSEDLDNDQGGAPGCMSGGMDGDCVEVFAALGLDLATGDASGEQQVFRVEER